MAGKQTSEIFPDFIEVIEYMGHDRQTIWKVLGYKSINTFDSAMTRQKKTGKLDPKLDFAVKVYKKMKKAMKEVIKAERQFND